MKRTSAISISPVSHPSSPSSSSFFLLPFHSLHASLSPLLPPLAPASSHPSLTPPPPLARPIDPKFPTTSPPHFASAFGGPPPSSRIYTLNALAAVERWGTRTGWYTDAWWQTASSDDYVPASVGGSVAAIAWAGEARVFYKAKTSGTKIAEVGVSEQRGDGVKWFPRGYVA